MPHPLWILHFFFWWPFVLRGQVQRRRGEGAHLGKVVHRHPRAVAFVAAHTVAMALVYVGTWVGAADPATRQPSVGLVVGASVAIAGSALARWTLQTFRSWRLRAELTEDHQLSTDGPFRWVRHPIYLAMDLLALGTLVWVPNPWTLAGFLANVVVGDLRARGEEQLLVRAFGVDYTTYAGKVRRFVPGVY